MRTETRPEADGHGTPSNGLLRRSNCDCRSSPPCRGARQLSTAIRPRGRKFRFPSPPGGIPSTLQSMVVDFLYALQMVSDLLLDSLRISRVVRTTTSVVTRLSPGTSGGRHRCPIALQCVSSASDPTTCSESQAKQASSSSPLGCGRRTALDSSISRSAAGGPRKAASSGGGALGPVLLPSRAARRS